MRWWDYVVQVCFYLLFVAIAALVVLMVWETGWGAEVTFAWDAPQEGTPADYVLLRKGDGGLVEEYITTATQLRVDVPEGVWVFSCVARDVNGVRSEESNSIGVEVFGPPVLRVTVP